jgi:hypothetical protein
MLVSEVSERMTEFLHIQFQITHLARDIDQIGERPLVKSLYGAGFVLWTVGRGEPGAVCGFILVSYSKHHFYVSH